MASTVTAGIPTRDKLLRARTASVHLARLSTTQKNAMLLVMAKALEANAASIIEANRVDLESSGISGAMRDRLMLNPARISAMADGIRQVVNLPDPGHNRSSHKNALAD